jgi:hypothetical protein
MTTATQTEQVSASDVCTWPYRHGTRLRRAAHVGHGTRLRRAAHVVLRMQVSKKECECRHVDLVCSQCFLLLALKLAVHLSRRQIGACSSITAITVVVYSGTVALKSE